MSTLSWVDALTQTLSHLRKDADPDRPPRVAVVGLGHELRGDDAAGIVVTQRLIRDERPPSAIRPSALIVSAGSAPENCTGVLRRFDPDLVMLVDAAQMGAPPGAVRWLAWQETSGLSASTHTMPPYVLAKYLTAELKCQMAVLGIQPADTTLGAPLSAPVERAVNTVIRELTFVLGIAADGRKESLHESPVTP